MHFNRSAFCFYKILSLKTIRTIKMSKKIIKLFLRLSISIGFLSAVADRFGMWNKEVAVWGNWENFLDYTKIINPVIPENLIEPVGIIATVVEIILPVFLLIRYKTETFAKISGFLLLIFALSMTFSTGIKATFDFSVFTASAAAFALSTMKEKFLELDAFANKCCEQN